MNKHFHFMASCIFDMSGPSDLNLSTWKCVSEVVTINENLTNKSNFRAGATRNFFTF